MGLKDEHLIKDVLIMNITVILSVVAVIGLALVFFVFAKGNYEKQAKEYVKAKEEKIDFQVAQIRDNIENNNLLWSLIDSTWKSPEKSIAFLKRLADSQKLPMCKGKPCTGDDAKLRTTITNNANEKSIRIGWSKYHFIVYFDPKDTKKDKFTTIDVSDLLGKKQDAGEEEYEEGEAEQ